MTTKSEIKKLLRSGLTGWEAGLLVFEDSWQSSREGPGFLTESDIASLKAGLKSQRDTDDYNTLIRLYRTADFMERQCISSLMASTAILERVAGIGYLRMAPFMSYILLRQMPLPVTEKQLKALKAQQRRTLLKKYYCMDEAISRRAYAQASEALKAEYEPENIEAGDPELYQKAEEEIAGLVAAGQLKPVKLDVLASSDPVKSGEREDIEAWYGASDEWTPEQQENYLRYYLTGQELYKAGLPEWKKEIDTFETWRLPEEYWLGGDPPDYVAIVQEPSSSSLDKRGYFKLDWLKHWPLCDMPQDQTAGLAEQAIGGVEMAVEQIKRMLAERQVLEELGQVVGLRLEEGIDFAIETFLKDALGRYNSLAKVLPAELTQRAEELGLTDMVEQYKAWNMALGNFWEASDRDKHQEATAKAPPIIKLEKIKPPAKDIADYRGWITEVFVENWWQRARSQEPKSLLPEEALQMLAKSRAEEAEDES